MFFVFLYVVFIGIVILFECLKIDVLGLCVLFVIFGMFSGGFLFEVFKYWVFLESNMIILLGWVIFLKLFYFCVCMGEIVGN